MTKYKIIFSKFKEKLERYNNIKNKCCNILINFIQHFNKYLGCQNVNDVLPHNCQSDPIKIDDIRDHFELNQGHWNIKIVIKFDGNFKEVLENLDLKHFNIIINLSFLQNENNINLKVFANNNSTIYSTINENDENIFEQISEHIFENIINRINNSEISETLYL